MYIKWIVISKCHSQRGQAISGQSGHSLLISSGLIHNDLPIPEDMFQYQYIYIHKYIYMWLVKPHIPRKSNKIPLWFSPDCFVATICSSKFPYEDHQWYHGRCHQDAAPSPYCFLKSKSANSSLEHQGLHHQGGSEEPGKDLTIKKAMRFKHRYLFMYLFSYMYLFICLLIYWLLYHYVL